MTSNNIKSISSSSTKIMMMCLILSGIAVVAINPVWGFYDSFMALLASGSLSSIFIEEPYHLGLRGMFQILASLHHFAPSYPWLAIIVFFAWVYIQNIVIALLVWLIPNRVWQLKQLVVLWVLLFLFVFGFSFVEFSITGIAMLLSFVSLLGIWSRVNYNSSYTQRILFLLICTVGIGAGFALRIESGIGGVLLGSIFVILYEKKMTNWLKALWLPAAISFAFLWQYNFAVSKSEFFGKVEPLVFYVTDSKNQPQYYADDSIEEMKIEMVRVSCLIDSVGTNYAFFSKLAEQKKTYERNFIVLPKQLIMQVWEVIYPTIINNKTFSLVTFLHVVLCSFMAFKSHKRTAIRLVAFNCVAFFIVLFLAYAMKMEQWHYIPLMQIVMLGNLLASAGFLPVLWSDKRQIVVTGVLCCCMLVYYVVDVKGNCDSINEKIAAQRHIEAVYKNSALFYDVNTRELLDDYAFSFYKQKQNIFFYDMAQMVYLKEYAMQLKNLCDCNPFYPELFFKYLKLRGKDVVYVSTSKRVGLLQNYMRVVYKFPILFTPKEKNTLVKTKHIQAVTAFDLYGVE